MVPGRAGGGVDAVSKYIVYMYENFNNKYKLKFKKEKKLISLYINSSSIRLYSSVSILNIPC